MPRAPHSTTGTSTNQTSTIETSTGSDALVRLLTGVPERLRSEQPLVQCLTNYVSMDLAANTLAAVGASPAMVHDEHEAAAMAGLASAVVVNIGTPSPPWVVGMHAAAATALERGVPWVLDPVAVGATAYRRETVTALLEHRPTVVRGNASEVRAMASATGAGRGVDSTDESTAVVSEARALARDTGAVVVVSGATDVVTDGDRVVLVRGGSPLMPGISALGCSTSALVGACCAVTTEPLEGAVAGMALMSAAGGRAARAPGVRGPGSLRVAILDELAGLDPSAFDEVELTVTTGAER